MNYQNKTQRHEDMKWANVIGKMMPTDLLNARLPHSICNKCKHRLAFCYLTSCFQFYQNLNAFVNSRNIIFRMIILLTAVGFSLGNECIHLIQPLIISFSQLFCFFPSNDIFSQLPKSLYYIQLNVIWNLQVLSHSHSAWAILNIKSTVCIYFFRVAATLCLRFLKLKLWFFDIFFI